MRKLSPFSPAWGCTVLVALLLVLAIVSTVTGRRLENEAASIETDSVPGLINAHTIRSAYSQGLVCALQAFHAPTAAEREAHLRHLAALDVTARTASDNYAKSMHIDPQADAANLQRVRQARDDFLRLRTRFLELGQNGARTEATQLLQQQLTPAYDALMQACDVLVAYNNRTGTMISASMRESVGYLRQTVIAVIVLSVAAGLGVIHSVRVQHRINEALRESERKFSTAFRVSPLSMTISRLDDGRILEANDALLRQFGRPRDEIVGRTSVELGFWSSSEERDAALQSLRHDGRLLNLRRDRVQPDGRRTITLLSAEPVVLGEETCVLTVSQDLTGLFNAEEAAVRSAAELRAIFESAAIGIALVDSDGRIVRANPALERFLGYRGEELHGMPFAQVTHPDDTERDARLFRQLIAGELSSYELEKRYLRKDGGTVWGDLTVSVMRDAGGRLIYGIGMVADVSVRKHAERALHESESARAALQQQFIVAQKLEALGQLAGGVAHDFNNLLAAMMLYLDLLKTESAISPRMRDSLTELGNAARRAAGLTRQLLLFSRREPVQRTNVDLNAVVTGLLKMLNRLVGEHFTLVQTSAPEPLWTYADPGMLEQIVMNLVVNARDAMPRGGRIELRLDAVEVESARIAVQPQARAGRFVRLTVADHGCGMSADTQARIFEPFFTTKQAGQGTGLGLSTVFGIVQQHAGWIEVESTEGLGSAFLIYLPAHAGATAMPTLAPAAAPARGCETILVAEDNESVRLAVGKILRKQGYVVLEASNGQIARDLLSTHPGTVDLLLSDVVMPGGLMGHELARDLPADKPPPKIILMSGYNTHVDPAALEAAGCAYLSKPFDTDRLLRVVRAILDGTTVRS